MRIEHSIKNISMSIISQVVIILLGFISRKIFINSLGSEYLGINGLLTNVLSAMVLIEGGIGISIVYNLYKPLAEDDRPKIIALIKLYKKAYFVLAIIMLCISYSLYPFLNKLMKTDSDIPGLGIVYFLFVMKSVCSYLYAYKWAIINSDQRGYHLAKNNLIFQVISMISKIIILLISKSYILYLIIEFIIFIIQNNVNSRLVDKLYPYLKTKENYTIDYETKNSIKKNVKAMFIQNIGSYAIHSTDNIIISSIINVSVVGIYSNYTMIIGQLSSLVSSIIGGISNSVGNLIATESTEKVYSVFKISYFISFWVYSFSTIFLYNLLEPFINWWIGDGYLLGNMTFIVILLNFYMSGLRTPINIFKSKSGLFAQDKYAAIIEGIINLTVSIVLAQKYGLIGVFLGTTISYLSLSFWNQPRIVYKEVFRKQLNLYFNKYLYYFLLTIITGFITTSCCNILVDGTSFMFLVLKGVICVIVPNTIYISIFYKTNEFKYLLNIFKPMITKMRNKAALN